MNPTQYDSSILQQFADDLYARARWIIISTAVVYGGVAFLLALVGTLAASHSMNLEPQNWALVATVTFISVGIGVSRGRDKAFQLKLQAQQILCQRQIEMNTRGASAPAKAFSANV